jgi:hypothetical protein
LNGNGNLDLNGNGNANGNFDANGNFNANTNLNSDTVSVNVNVDADLTPVIGFKDMFNHMDNHDGSMLFMPQDITQTINDQGGQNGPAGDGTDTMIALDQVNSLVSNGTVDGASVSSDASGVLDHDHVFAGGSSDSIGSTGDSGGNGDAAAGTGTISGAASSTGQLDAFTQSIVLGANIQYNNFNLSVVGHDAITTVGDGHHS